MILPFSFQIRLLRFFRRVVVAYTSRFSLDSNAGAPFILKTYHTHKARFVAFIWLANVLRISVLKHFSQIFKSVVRFLSVYVINKFNRPFASHIKPSQTVRAMDALIYPYGGVPNSFFFAPRNCPNLRAFSSFDFPRKNSRGRVIIKYLVQSVVSKFRHLRLLFNVLKITLQSNFCKALTFCCDLRDTHTSFARGF